VNARRAYLQWIPRNAPGCNAFHAHNGAPQGSRVHARTDEIWMKSTSWAVVWLEALCTPVYWRLSEWSTGAAQGREANRDNANAISIEEERPRDPDGVGRRRVLPRFAEDVPSGTHEDRGAQRARSAGSNLERTQSAPNLHHPCGRRDARRASLHPLGMSPHGTAGRAFWTRCWRCPPSASQGLGGPVFRSGPRPSG